MPSCSSARNPRGDEIRFDEATHTYISPATRIFDKALPTTPILRYVSGTQFVHHFFPKFDSTGDIALSVARKRGVSVDQVRFEWAQNAAAACELGTRVHETCEDILLDRRDLLGQRLFRNAPHDDREKRLFAAAWTACQQVLTQYEVLGVERIVFDLDCLLAGTIDLLARHRETADICILDWKTNRKIDLRNTFRQDRFGLPPIEHLENCNFIHYALQLNLYQKLLVKAGYFPRTTRFRRAIIHLTEQGPTTYNLPDLQPEISDMMISMLERPLEFLSLKPQTPNERN